MLGPVSYMHVIQKLLSENMIKFRNKPEITILYFMHYKFAKSNSII